MKWRKKLFALKSVYNIEKSDKYFLRALKENIHFQMENSEKYRKIIVKSGFRINDLQHVKDIHKIPPIPTLFIKRNNLTSISSNKWLYKSMSSGTSGKQQSVMGLDMVSSLYAAKMAIKTFMYHDIISLTPTNYIVLGYEANRRNKTGASQRFFATTLFAPAVNREYALKLTQDKENKYELNIDGIKKAIVRYAKSTLPIRIVGFPAYLYELLQELDEENVRLRFNIKSKIFVAGGWKQFAIREVEKEEIYRLAYKVLGIKKESFKDLFGAIEHPIVYCDCKNNNFHVPIYSRVIIRNPKTLEPVDYGMPGILNLITPIAKSMALVSVMTDDMAVMYPADKCGCGIKSPYFNLLGRAGVADIKTCAASAVDLLGGGN